ncbi:MAG: hypothetical protein IJ692_06325 [Alloprevotella sp.]|nr:hypothetical protein [Alloprevotella sp.]MBR1652987.1 hypothetical protein [Alloprevotella sp.]
MKKVLFLLAALLAPCLTHAQIEDEEEFHFSDRTLTFAQIEQEWQVQNLYTLTQSPRPDIKEYFLSFALAYPNDPLQRILAQVLGYDQEGTVGNYVMDVKNGYLQAELLTELTLGVQMCYWRMTDGGTLVGVCFFGDEYKMDDDGFTADCDEDDRTICINDLMFFRINPDECIWRPRTPQALCGRMFDFSAYDIQLPRQGKDIRLTHKTNPSRSLVLRWTGKGFDVKK